MLVPVCAYMVMAIALNLVVGILGELSLGHAGVRAFTGIAWPSCCKTSSLPRSRNIAMLVRVGLYRRCGFLIGIPFLRLKGTTWPS